MAVGERCPACGQMPGAEITKLTVQRDLIGWAVQLTHATSTPADSPEQVSVRLATLHGALMRLTFAKTTDEPAA
jgi:hypothetical protein